MVLAAIEATRRVVSTNTNLGIVLLLAPLAAVPEGIDLADGVERVLAETTVADACLVYRAIRLAQPGGMGEVRRPGSERRSDDDAPRSDVPGRRARFDRTSVRERISRSLGRGAAGACANLYERVSRSKRRSSSAYLHLLARHPDSLIARKHGLSDATEVSRRAALVLAAGWPTREKAGGFATNSTSGCGSRTTDTTRERPPTW